jgi:hypothetical protein
VAIWPASAPPAPLSLVSWPVRPTQPPGTPRDFRAEGDAITWSAPMGTEVLSWRTGYQGLRTDNLIIYHGEVFWYRIYRSQQPDFQPGPDTFLTYVDKGTTRFRDASEDFAGRKRQGNWYYRVTAVSKDDWESPPTAAVKD